MRAVPEPTEKEKAMAEQVSFVQEGVDRVNATFRSIDEEFERVQKRLQARRKSIEKQLASSRRDLEKRTRKQVKKLRGEMRKNPLVKRAQTLREDAAKQFESSVESVLGAFQIASKSDLTRIDRRLSSLNRKLKELESERKHNGSGRA
jgi:hypothetical protein